MCRLFDLLAFVDISLPHSYYFPNKLCLGFVFQALMENPKLCHDKSKHSYMLNIFCFPLLCCQCLGVKKGLRRLSVETVVEVGCSQSLELWVTAAAGSLLPQSNPHGLNNQNFPLTDKCSYPCLGELLEGLLFHETDIISLYNAVQITKSLRCASCTSARQITLDWGAWRRGAAAETPWFVIIWTWALSLCKSELRAAFQGNEGTEFQKGLGDVARWLCAWVQHTGSAEVLHTHVSCHLMQQVPKFLPETISKPAKSWQSWDTLERTGRAMASWGQLSDSWTCGEPCHHLIWKLGYQFRSSGCLQGQCAFKPLVWCTPNKVFHFL